MNRNISLFAFLLGLAAVIWVAVGYIGGSGVALATSALIAAVYLAGAVEMRRYHGDTAALARALRQIPDDLGHLGEWLQHVPPALQNAVRLRVEGERVALPGPSVTPYLVGLLVLLGMLGTFLGMVVTLNGAVLALESTTDLHTIRAALAAPVKGLGVAFGTSVAGVATSAMLGLISALCRRDRLQVGQLLDSRIAGVLCDFSLAHQRQETFKALQSQAQTLPELIGRLDAMASRMAEQNRQLGEHLLAGQQSFYQEARGLYSGLAQSVEQSLQATLRDSARVAAEAIQPVVTTTMQGIADEARGLHERLQESVRGHIDGVAGRLDQAVVHVADTWKTLAARHEQASERLVLALDATRGGLADRFAERAAGLLADLRAAQAAWQDQWAAGERDRQAVFSDTLAALAARLETQWQRAGQAAQVQQQEIARSFDDSARGLVAATQRQAEATIAEVTRLMQTAAEAPKAAAEVIGQLRNELSASMARDNTLLAERSRIMETLGTLLTAINHAAGEQRGAIDALVGTSAELLERVGSRFAAKVDSEAGKLVEIGAGLAGGALEVASLGDAFGHAVGLFAESNDKMMTTLQRIEGALAKSLTRSDEQLAYYVAQAREIIDLSILSQKQMVDELQRAAGPRG